mmetsp:Transcript_5610/g.17246  ORF Transcript_5610/g.17246 Transcript_5610/m.17246 type:complete len:289 (+) Transcript_5610:354-1220(+)
MKHGVAKRAPRPHRLHCAPEPLLRAGQLPLRPLRLREVEQSRSVARRGEERPEGGARRGRGRLLLLGAKRCELHPGKDLVARQPAQHRAQVAEGTRLACRRGADEVVGGGKHVRLALGLRRRAAGEEQLGKPRVHPPKAGRRRRSLALLRRADEQRGALPRPAQRRGRGGRGGRRAGRRGLWQSGLAPRCRPGLAGREELKREVGEADALGQAAAAPLESAVQRRLCVGDCAASVPPQVSRHLCVPLRLGLLERRAAPPVPPHQRGARLLDQETDRVQLALAGGQMQR